MQVLIYNEIDNLTGVKKQVDKVIEYLQKGDLKSADVKKMSNTGFYRAKLDDKNRLLFRIGRHGGERFIFITEIILNHDYAKSRFLNGAISDERDFTPLSNLDVLKDDDLLPVSFVNRKVRHFNILDKILSFDDIQSQVFSLAPPLIIIGSAGSGKTALTLEKIKHLRGSILYITLSPFLVENARNLYYSNGYDNDKQEIDFLSFHEYVQTIHIPQGREVTYRDFVAWIWRHQQGLKIRDSHKIFEEFKGVITGSIIDKPYLTRDEYLNLGIRRSVFNIEEREQLYGLFLKYLDFLKENNFYDSNLVSYERLAKVPKKYDFVVVDEVQDITNVQLYLILKSLHLPTNFLLCGDSNQIVHPNFFSWSNIKTMFYHQDLKGDIIRILATNYRNTPEVTHIANQLLLVKNARFGSIDKESTYLVQPNSAHEGAVEFYEDTPKVKQDFNQKTKRSTKFAVLVMRDEDKAEARKFFQTPLLFSVQEAKGLEYENIILWNIISGNDREFRVLTEGVSKDALKSTEIAYARAKDKTDKDLEVYKFYVNSLYVAITRAVKNLYVIEKNKKHELLELLDLTQFQQQVGMKEQQSSLEEWQREARKLEMQGKQEQAEEIRKSILHVQKVPWTTIELRDLAQLKTDALNTERFNKKAKDRLFEYAIFYEEPELCWKLQTSYPRAKQWETETPRRMRAVLNDYYSDKVKGQPAQQIQKYGVDFRDEFNFTPLMNAARTGAIKVIDMLKDYGADTHATDNYGRTAFQLALLMSFRDSHFAKKSFATIYQKLQTDSIKVRVDNQLIKIHNRTMEYFMFNYMLALMHYIFNLKINELGVVPGFQTSDFLTAVEHYPTSILPDYRKQRTYLTSILSKNEFFSKNPYNRKLFVRLKQGYYLINPFLDVQIGEDWYNPYELLDIESFKTHDNPRKTHFYKNYEWLKSHLLESAV